MFIPVQQYLLKNMKAVIVLLITALAMNAHSELCFSRIQAPNLSGMWNSVEGLTLAGGSTFIDFGEVRLYHDETKLYVYVRNDFYYTTGSGNLKFDVSPNLEDLGIGSSQLNNEQHQIDASTPPGTVIWFETNLACWGISEICNEGDNIYVSIHINGQKTASGEGAQTIWVGNPETTCFKDSPWYCYSVLPRLCIPPVTTPPPEPDYSECQTGFGLPFEGPVGPTQNFQEGSWGWSFFYVPTGTALLDIVVGAGQNNLDNGHIFGTLQLSISNTNVVSVSFNFTSDKWVVSEFHIDIESAPKYRRGAVGKYKINIDYTDVVQYYNEEGPLLGL